ncbi:hypothetical protein GCM10010531_15330 [Blastococcus jejuensis]|uniref:Uncharacterized protein n=1 Tax=Blastococcus jejuensis TaxID=351224 RepID=A0ABP6P1A2_9ACTN
MTRFAIPYEANDFPSTIPSLGRLSCSWPGLLRSATSLAGSTIGSSRSGLSWLPGVALEFAWRAALVGANLRQRRRGGQPLLQTSQYRALDPSEKSAVSFFLGQVSAKHFADYLLNAPIFARVDEAMKAAGLPLVGRRPDFYGWGPGVGVIAVEAKGRSGIWSNQTMQKAKKQAGDLPRVLGGGAHTAIAHMAYFERRHWKAWLLDPSPRRRQQDGPPLEAVLLAYYQPFAQLLEERGAGDASNHNGVTYDMAELPEVDLRIGLRRDLHQALLLPGRAYQERGAMLRRSLDDSDLEPISQEHFAEQQLISVKQAAQLAEEEAETGRSTGADGVMLQAGASWTSVAMSLEPPERYSVE